MTRYAIFLFAVTHVILLHLIPRTKNNLKIKNSEEGRKKVGPAVKIETLITKSEIRRHEKHKNTPGIGGTKEGFPSVLLFRV